MVESVTMIDVKINDAETVQLPKEIMMKVSTFIRSTLEEDEDLTVVDISAPAKAMAIFATNENFAIVRRYCEAVQ